MQRIFPNIQTAIQYALGELKTKGEVRTTESWQGLKNEVRMWEYDELYFRAIMPQGNIEIQRQTKATQPWAEDHFQERVGGQPLNPGEQYKNWPFYGNKDQSNNRFRNVNYKFSHSYMERYWPKFANPEHFNSSNNPVFTHGNFGIRYAYGDLMDVIELLHKEPNTRQAYLPVWFPEDTGVLHGGRVPCTIGYHFIVRDYRLHINYHIRSCDALRHFKNDIYLTVRLGQWVLQQLCYKDIKWAEINMGILSMNITNFHCFEQEKNLI